MRRTGARYLLAVAIGSALCLFALGGSGAATGAPRMSVSPAEGPLGTQLTISGQGFQPSEAIFLDIYPVGAPHGLWIGRVSADSTGQFVVNTDLGIVYPGPELPDPAPPGGGQRVNHAPGDYEVRAYPESLGHLTPSPKVAFKVTVGSLPSTGGQLGSNQQDLPVELAAGLLLVLIGAAMWRRAVVSG
jgi:hypothetical protein